MSPLRSFVDAFKNVQHIDLVIHERPDGDAIGSAWALQKIIGEFCTTAIVSTSPIPKIFEQALNHKLKTQPQLSSQADLIILLDCSQFHRTGLEKELSALDKKKVKILAIDHHSAPNRLPHLTNALINTEASSTAELIYQCIDELRVAISSEVAQGLLLGLFTDTGGFRHANTSSKVLAIASRLVRTGANLEQLTRLFGQHRTLSKTKLWGAAFSKVRITNYGLAITTIPLESFIETGATLDDVSGLANHLALLDEARAAVVMVETDKGWRATLRTRHPHIDLRRIAKLYGGRGTQKASGFSFADKRFSGKIT